MKKLVSLAMKYVRRQKLRTTLTFLCVMLAVFILNAYALFCSSMIRTLRNQVVYDYGAWEVNLFDAFEEATRDENGVSHPDEAAAIAKDHPAVDKLDYFSDAFYRMHCGRDENSYVSLFELNLDNGASAFSEYICQQKNYVDGITQSSVLIGNTSDIKALEKDSAIVPQWFKESGYNIGDTVTVTIKPFKAKIDMNCDVVKKAYKMAADNNADTNNRYIRFSDDEMTDEEREKMLKRANQGTAYMPTLLYFIGENFSLSDLEYTDRENAPALTVTMKIAGFNEWRDDIIPDFFISTSLDTDIDFSPIADSTLLEESNIYGSALIVTNQNLDFDDCLCSLFDGLGQDGEGFYQYLYDSNMIDFNDSVLAVNLRSFRAINEILPTLIFFILLLLVVWFFSRFVIDNAFEISVSERSSQFALLRVMGASKGQLLMLVFTEGVFYSITALPLGILLSHLVCSTVFNSFHNTGLTVCEYYPSAIAILLAVLLSLSAIFISTYTSAMWASRKLSPTEAMNFGKPSKRRRKVRHRKSKLNAGSKRFTVRYTFKNIFRTKKRFLVSTIALALGVTMFTLCVELGILFSSNVKLVIENSHTYDYAFYCDTEEEYNKVLEIIDKNDSFINIGTSYNSSISFFENTDDWDILTAIKPEITDQSSQPHVSFEAWGENKYNSKTAFLDKDGNIAYTQSIGKLLGKTYEEFESDDKCYLLLSVYGTGFEVEMENGKLVKKYEECFKPVSDYGLGEYAEFMPDNMEKPLKLAGIIYCECNTAVIVPHRVFLDATKDSPSYMSRCVYTNIKDASSFSSAQPAIEEISDIIGYHNVTINYMLCSGFRQFIGTVIFIAIVLMLVIWLTGIFSMMNTVNTSVLNRSRELLMMRSVGMTKKQLAGAIILEAVLFSAVSTIIGIIVGSGVFTVIYQNLFRDNIGSSVSTIVIAVILTLIINIIISCLAAMPGIKSLSKNVKQMLF